MGLKIGTEDIAAAYLGGDELAAIYVGDEKVWPTLPVAHWIEARANTIDQAVHDFGSFTIPVDGLVVVGFAAPGGDADSVSEISIGGSPATMHTSTTGGYKVAFASRAVSAGSHNVTVTLNDANGDADVQAVGVWVVEGLNSNTPVEAYSSGGSANTSRTATLDMEEGGVALYVLARNTDTEVTWTDATQRGTGDGNGHQGTFADHSPTPNASDHTETASWGATAGSRIAGVSFR